MGSNETIVIQFENDWIGFGSISEPTSTPITKMDYSTSTPNKLLYQDVFNRIYMDVFNFLTDKFFEIFDQEFIITKFQYYLLLLGSFVTVILSKSTGQDLVIALIDRLVDITTYCFTSIYNIVGDDRTDLVTSL